MWNPFSPTQNNYFSRQAKLIGTGNTHFGKTIQQRPRVLSSKPKLVGTPAASKRYAPLSEGKFQGKWAKGTLELNRHHAYKMLAKYPHGPVRAAAWVVLNTPTGKIDSRYANAVRLLAEVERNKADAKKKSRNAPWEMGKKLTPAQQEITNAVDAEKMVVQINNDKRDGKQRIDDRLAVIAAGAKARKTKHIANLHELTPVKRNIADLEQALDAFGNTSLEEPDSLVVFVDTPGADSDDSDDSEVVHSRHS